MSTRPTPMALIVLDGWGYSEKTENNAILAANTPIWDKLWSRYSKTLIRTSGAAVGLPADQMGNSEVGHLNLGSGRVVYQEFTRVSRAIRTGSFFTNRTLTDAVDLAIENNKAVHVLGLLSPGGVHSHEEQIHAMLIPMMTVSRTEQSLVIQPVIPQTQIQVSFSLILMVLQQPILLMLTVMMTS